VSERLLTTRAVAEAVSLSPETILRRYRAGELRGVRLASNDLRAPVARLARSCAAGTRGVRLCGGSGRSGLGPLTAHPAHVFGATLRVKEASHAVDQVVILTESRHVDLFTRVDDVGSVGLDALVTAGAERVRLVHTEGFCAAQRTFGPLSGHALDGPKRENPAIAGLSSDRGAEIRTRDL
jgi:hypothetical protein